MREWTLINESVDPTGEGVSYAQNVSLQITGECGRRKGMGLAAALGARLIAPTFTPGSGYAALLITSTGTMETVAL